MKRLVSQAGIPLADWCLEGVGLKELWEPRIAVFAQKDGYERMQEISKNFARFGAFILDFRHLAGFRDRQVGSMHVKDVVDTVFSRFEPLRSQGRLTFEGVVEILKNGGVLQFSHLGEFLTGRSQRVKWEFCYQIGRLPGNVVFDQTGVDPELADVVCRHASALVPFRTEEEWTSLRD